MYKAKSNCIKDGNPIEAIISEELFEKAQIKRRETAATGNPSVGRNSKHLLSGILKCPMCGSSMYAAPSAWTNRDGTRNYKWRYQCGHYAKSKFGQCKKNAILAEWIEGEVIVYTKLLVRNPQFAEDIQKQIGQKVDVSEIDAEIENYRRQLKKLERSRGNLEKDIDDIADEDRNAERKRQDMNRRLNRIYEEIYYMEDQIRDCERKKAAVEQDALTQDGVYKMLLAFDKFFDKMSKEDKRKMMESLVSEVHLHPKETWDESKNPIKCIKYAFPLSAEVMESLGENVASVETVVLLSRKKTSSKSTRIEIDIDLDEADRRECIGKATYQEIRDYIWEHYQTKVSHLYIAQIKKKCGLDVGENFNKAKTEGNKVPNCPPEKD